MAQVYFCGQLLQLQNLLVFFDGLHLHFGRCCSPRLCNYALARLFSCAIVFLYDCVVVRGSFVCNIFSFLCCYKTARLCCCICFLNNYAVTIKMFLCVCAIVFLCRVSCQRVLLYFCANEYSNTEYRTSTSSRPHNCATRCAFRLVRQTKGRFPKMGKKCFCRTMKFSPQNFSPQKHLAHFLRDTSFLWHKYIFAVSSSSFKICLYFLMVCISILGGAALHVCVIMLLQDYSLVRLFSCTIV